MTKTVCQMMKVVIINHNSEKTIICDYAADKIVVINAHYFYGHEHSSCAVDVTSTLNSVCSGLHTCYIKAHPTSLGTDSCHEYNKNLLVQYYCKPWERKQLFRRKKPNSQNSTHQMPSLTPSKPFAFHDD